MKHAAGGRAGAIRGVVHPRGVTRFAGRGRWFWTQRIYFWLIAWREGDGPLDSRSLRVEREIPFGTRRLWARRIPGGATIAFEAGPVSVDDYGTPRVEMRGLLEEVGDPALAQAAAPFLTEVRHESAFGTLVRPRGGDDYSGAWDWHGQTVEMHLDATAIGDFEQSLASALALHAAWPEWDARLRAMVEADLLDSWREWNADEPPIDGATLFGRMQLHSIEIWGGEWIDLWFDCGDAFGDHQLKATGSIGGGLKEIDIG
ncbi:MAG: DUF2262 domain-containing protein [Sphingomonas sp.]